MKVSYNWLQDYLDKKLPSPEKLAEVLTMHSFEVEDVVPQGKGLEMVVVGEVTEKKKHPNADKLSLVKIKIAQNKTLNIVCGAPNIEAGQKVPVALIGAELPNGMKIEKREVRGEVSHGMVCSGAELGLEKQSQGIMVLDKKAKIGTPIAKVLGLTDSILDISILPNRNHDCLGHFWIAKEVAALLNCKIKEPKVKKYKIGKVKKVTVENKAKDLCPRYMARYVAGVNAGSSPEWVKNRLESVGQRSISNLVDATNFVMLELNQPMHAFDADKISGKIIIRRAKKGERFVTLDNQSFELDEDVLLIADDKDALAIAGIKGGKKAEVDASTKNIILEAANFDQSNIRRTSQKLGLKTDSSLRYENGIAHMADLAMERVSEIISESAGGVFGDKTDVYPKKQKPVVLGLLPQDVSKFLGVEVKEKEIADTLKKLGFGVKKMGKILKVVAPMERIDIETEADLIEEVARMYGLYKIPSILPEEIIIPPKRNDNVFFANLVKDILVGAGFSEVYNYSFAQSGEVELANPIDKSKKFLKTNLIEGLRENVKTNSAHFKKIKIFEIGKIYSQSGENISLAGLMHPGEFAETKGVLETLLEKVGIEEYYFNDHPDKIAEIRVGNTSIGYIDHNSFEVSFEELVRLAEEEVEFFPISKYPAVKRDVALYVPIDTRITEVEDVIQNSGGPLLSDVDLFDIYEESEDNRKSLAFHLIFQSHDKTLTDIEAGELLGNVIKALESNANWEVRKG